MSIEEQKILEERLAKAKAAAELAASFTRVSNSIANSPNVTIQINGCGVYLTRCAGDEASGQVNLDTAELRQLIVNYLVQKQLAAIREWESA